MSTHSDENPRDRLGYLTTLREVLHHPGLSAFRGGGTITPEAEAAAAVLAETIGYCRLFGIEPPADVDGTIPAHVALAAARSLRTRLEQVLVECDLLPERWENARSQLEMDSLCSDLLHVRMSAWATLVALHEAWAAAAERRQAGADELEDALDTVISAIDRFDVALRRDVELVATVTGTNLLENWRSMLADEHASALPWWLDGTLERTTEAIERRATCLLPGPPSEQSRQQPRGADAPRSPMSPTPAVLPFHAIRELFAIPAAYSLAAEGQELRPFRKSLRWNSRPDGSGHSALLQIPSRRDPAGQTKLEISFRPAGDSTELALRDQLLGKPAILALARSHVCQRTVAGQPLLFAWFLLEDIPDIGIERLDLSVDGCDWYPSDPGGTIP